MRGRAEIFKASYRSAKQHMALALNFLKNDKVLKSEVDKFYTDDSNDNNLNVLNNGSVEFISGKFNSIGDKIIELKKLEYKNEDFLILYGTKNNYKDIKNRSSEEIGGDGIY